MGVCMRILRRRQRGAQYSDRACVRLLSVAARPLADGYTMPRCSPSPILPLSSSPTAPPATSARCRRSRRRCECAPARCAWTARGLAEFSTLQQLPRPRTALLIGGPRRGLGLDEAWFDDLLGRVAARVAGEHGSLMIACSRRTPARWRARLTGLLRDGCTHLWCGPGDGVNPYAGYLAAADRLVVTPDSVNMLSEACATGKPVFSLLPPAARGRLVALHAELREQGWLHALDENVDFSTLQQPPPLRELAVVAGKVWHAIEATRPDIAVALTAS